MRLPVVVISSVLAIGLFGCSDALGDDSGHSGTDHAVPESPVATDGTDDPATGDGDDLATTPPEDFDEKYESFDLNDRGNQQVDVDDQADFEDVDTGILFATITAEKIEPNFECTAPDAYPSINGQFVAITYDIDVRDQFAESGFPSLYFSVHEFSAWDVDGNSVIDPVGNAESCISLDDRVTTPLDPGEHAKGLVVLDLPEGPGSASFTLGSFQGAYGWEWSWQ